MCDYAGATWVGCSAKQFRPLRAANLKPDGIVIHVMAGYLRGTDAFFAQSPQERLIASRKLWLANGRKGPEPTQLSESSAHYGIGGVGQREVHQYVREADTAWHAGVLNKPTWAGLNRHPNVNPNAWTIGIEHEGFADTPWSSALYEESAKLIADIAKRWGFPVDKNYVCGHHDIYSIKSCPGLCDLEKLILLAQEVK